MIKIKCPHCGFIHSKVVDKRISEEIGANKRRRECLQCHKRFTTFERPEIESEITSIKKRDGTIASFDQQKITNAIYKAACSVGGENKDEARRLASIVISFLDKEFGGKKTPSVEEVQDIVEKVLIEEGHAKTAKAYILYREKHKKIRDTRSMFVDVQHTMSSYLKRSDWKTKENANEDYSFSGLMLYTAGKVISNYVLNEIYTPAIADAHAKGYFHIHDLYNGVIGYCCGHSLKKLLQLGFGNVPNKVDCKPAKHLNTVIHQMVNYIGCLQMEFAGAQAFSSVDTLLAPFIKTDNLSFDAVKQCMQQLVFSLNIPSRWGGQCVSADTECLTLNGWKLCTQLRDDDKIATFNTKTNRIEHLSFKLNIYDFDGKMVLLENRGQEQLVTPNHKVLRLKFNSDKYELIEANKIHKFKTPILVPISSQTSSIKEIDDEVVRLYAWLVSEGCFNGDRGRVTIYQSIKHWDNCEEIRSILTKLGYTWDETKRVHGFIKINKSATIRFRINQEGSRKINKAISSKKVPNIIKTLSARQIKLFIDTYVKGDGHINRGRIRIYTKNKDVRDQIQELCVLCGYGSTTYQQKNGVWTINLIRNKETSITVITTLQYKGKVWCPTTKNGTFVARRNGAVFITGNSPFSNLTFDWAAPEDMKNEKAIVGGKKQDFTYGDCQKEMDVINKAFLEVMLAGDAKGRIFSFPIPTYNLTKDFDWNSENSKLLFEVTAKYGLPYFQNYIGSGLDPKGLRAMCCRLLLDQSELIKRPGGMWSMGESTGSIGVVTINMNRLGYESKGDEKTFFNKLKNYMQFAKDSLETKRTIVDINLTSGLMPFTKTYLGTFNNHFSTIGLCGMNECCLNFLQKDIGTKEGKEFTIKVLNFMRDTIKQFQIETGNLYNLEATPAESTSYRFARLDKEMYPNIITAGTDEPYLTNSTCLPVNYTDDIFEAIEHQNDIQPLYTGGTIFHTFLGERISSGEACKVLVKKIAENTKLPYFSITPTFSICHEHGYLIGEKPICPDCGKETEVYSRIVGYFRPVKNWNPGKQQEFKERKEYIIA